MKHGKKYVEGAKLIDRTKLYDSEEALALAVKTATAKFDETVEVHIRLGVDSRHADQQVRGAVVLPNGTGKKVRTLVFAKGDKAKVDYRLAHEEFEVPFWIWRSKKYQRRHPDMMKRIKRASSRPFMTDNLSHLLLYLAGISCPEYRSDYNPLEDDYNEKRPRILKGQEDYNLIKELKN